MKTFTSLGRGDTADGGVQHGEAAGGQELEVTSKSRGVMDPSAH